MTKEQVERLLETAEAARLHAYAPYSGFLVGAALQSSDGRVYAGCNVENASFGGTVCAERVSLGAAIAEGVRSFLAIAVVGGRAGETAEETCFPCGICLQALAEFCDGDFPVYLRGKAGVCTYTLRELLPHSFSLEDGQ